MAKVKEIAAVHGSIARLAGHIESAWKRLVDKGREIVLTPPKSAPVGADMASVEAWLANQVCGNPATSLPVANARLSTNRHQLQQLHLITQLEKCRLRLHGQSVVDFADCIHFCLVMS